MNPSPDPHGPQPHPSSPQAQPPEAATLGWPTAYAPPPAYPPPPVSPPPAMRPPGRPRLGCLLALMAAVVVLAVVAGLVWLGWLLNGTNSPEEATGSADTGQVQEAPPGTDSKRSPDQAAQHTVNPDASVTPALTGQEAAEWQNFVNLIGARRVVAKIETVEFYANPDDDVMASVARTSDDGVHFDLQINLAYAGKGQEKDLAHTYIHEFSHTMSLSSDQVSQVSGKCPRLTMEEGCALASSWINQFRDEFWQRYGFTAPSKDESDQEKIGEFYNAHKGDFVTEYAATSVTEDYAESFTAWVMEPKAPGGGLIAQKFAFFDRFPDLVAFREDVRTRLDPAWIS